MRPEKLRKHAQIFYLMERQLRVHFDRRVDAKIERDALRENFQWTDAHS